MFDIKIKDLMKNIEEFQKSRIDNEAKIENLIKTGNDSFKDILNNYQKNIKIDILNIKEQIKNENINEINDKEKWYKNQLELLTEYKKKEIDNELNIKELKNENENLRK